jgi:hypothetical protein
LAAAVRPEYLYDHVARRAGGAEPELVIVDLDPGELAPYRDAI